MREKQKHKILYQKGKQQWFFCFLFDDMIAIQDIFGGGKVERYIKPALIRKPAVKSLKRHYWERDRWLYAMMVLPLLYLIIFNYIPMFGTIIAFKDFNMIKGIWGSEWIGFENFNYLFRSKEFYQILRNSLLLSFYRLIWCFPVPIILALFLNEIRGKRFKKVSQTILYMPYFISWVVLAGMITQFLSPTEGIINYLLSLFGVDAIPFLSEPKYFRSIIVISDIWKNSGWDTIIYLAAIAGIDQEMYEAAYIDGASRLQRVFKITLPSIMSTIIVMLILRMGSVLKNGFEQILLLYSPLTYEVADVFETYTYRVGVTGGRLGYSTAVGIFQSVVGFVMIMTANKLARKFGETGLY